MKKCEAMGCDSEVELFCNDQFFCEACGVEYSKATRHMTQPIMMASQLDDMDEDERMMLDPLTVIVDDNEHNREHKTFSTSDIDTHETLLVQEGITIVGEPIVMARCIFCEAYAIGHINKVGGWLARHQHYHGYIEHSDDDDHPLAS